MKRKGSIVSWDRLEDISAAILDGGVLLTPTDTVMGLASLPEKEHRLNEIKKSPDTKPLIRLVSGLAQARSVWVDPEPCVMALAQLWPGALTIIAGKDQGVALRMPDYPPLGRLLELTGPLSCTSANLSGLPAPSRLEQVDGKILALCDLIIRDSDHKPDTRPSTILSRFNGRWLLLREGSIAAETWEKIIGPVEQRLPRESP